MNHNGLKYYYPTKEETVIAVNIFTDTIFSARHLEKIVLYPMVFAFTFCLIVAGLIFYDYETRLNIISIASVIVFTLPVMLKWAIVVLSLFKINSHIRYPLLSDEELPIYTILVPLYKEGAIFVQLKHYLEKIDYPINKLDIMLLLEEDDECTRKTIEKRLKRNNPFDIKQLIVPPLKPRTKPKAMNVALNYIKGDYFVIFDAEDRPESDQLRKAASFFKILPKTVGALQAKLSFHNIKQTWFLTRMFGLEYEVLFNHYLEGLFYLKQPIPLAGTSTHMRTSDIKNIGGWDAYNVTEDCDLGMRLYAKGYTTLMLNSITYEEAVSQLPIWIKQRTRWMKGYIQTLVTHLRYPIAAYKMFGLYRMFGIYAIVGGQVFSALLYPACWIFYCISLMGFVPTVAIKNIYYVWGLHILMFTGFILPVVQATLTSFATKKDYSLIGFSLLHTIYWFFAGIAAHRALWQLLYDPFKWEKTPHGETDNRSHQE